MKIAKTLSSWIKKSFFIYIIVSIFIFFLLFTIFFIGTITVSRLGLLQKIDKTHSPDQLYTYTFLVFGIDNTTHIKRADTILTVHINPKEKYIGVLFIPRDTYVNIPGKKRKDKINHAYSFGGTELLKQTVTQLLGIPIDYYCEIKLNAVKSFIDFFGGVEVSIEKDLKYTDVAGNLYIDIKKGRQTLSGNEVLGYLRFRKDRYGDIGRIHRHEKFLKEVIQQLLKKQHSYDLPSTIHQIYDTLHTDMPFLDILSLYPYLSKILQEGQIKFDFLPGKISVKNGVSYWETNEEAKFHMIKKLLLGQDYIKKVKKQPKKMIHPLRDIRRAH